MVPIIDKDTIKYITTSITPEETEYVAGVSNVYDAVANSPVISDENSDDVLYIVKLHAFKYKFDMLIKTEKNQVYRKHIQDLYFALGYYIDNATEYVQSIIGQLTNDMFKKLNLPISDNPLEVVNELKQCVNNFVDYHKDDVEYKGMELMNIDIIKTIHTAIYNFRLSK